MLKYYHTDLSYMPWFINEQNNHKDSSDEYDAFTKAFIYGGPAGFKEFTDDNFVEVKKVVESARDTALNIVEIGIARNTQNSTEVFMNYKSPDCKYLGIDIRDGSFLNNPEDKIFTYRGDSRDPRTVEYVKKFTGGKIDILMIDGDHSLHTVLFEFLHYVPMVPAGGYVIMHDITHHPGPKEIFQAANPNTFEKYAYGQQSDYGLGVLRRK